MGESKVHTEFSRWYGAVSLHPDEQLLSARFDAVQSLSQAAGRQSVEALVHLAFRARPQPTSQAEILSIRNKLAGEAGPVADEELHLLSAATLAEILRNSTSLTALTAILIKTASFGGFRPLHQPVDLVGLSNNAIRSLATSSRTRSKLMPNSVNAPKVDVAAAVEKLKDGAEDGMASAMTMLGTAIRTGLSTLHSRQTQFEQAVQKYVAIQDEELDMLWWLQGGKSSSTGCAFDKIPEQARPFIFSRELADVTATLPGPLAIDSLLSRAGISGELKLTVADAVQNLDMSWLENTLKDCDGSRFSPLTTPIHEAFKRRGEVQGSDAWIGVWRSVCDLKNEEPLNSLSLAELVYYERLLVRGD